MVFLLAYGFLLRQSVLYAGRHRWNRLARHVVVVSMVADATENLCALEALRTIEEGGSLSQMVFTTMNAAAIAKWVLIGVVMMFLAAKWRRRSSCSGGGLRLLAIGVLLAFAAGGLGSIAVAASFWLPSVRDGAATAAAVGLATAVLFQFRFLDMIGIALRLVSLARVPVIVLLITAAFGPVALGPLSRLLAAILDVPTPWGIAVVTAAASVLAFACATQINLVRAYGAQRTLDPTLLVLQHRVLGRTVSWTAAAAAASLVFSVGLASLWISVWQVAAGVIGGAAFSVLFLFAIEWTALLMTEGHSEQLMPKVIVQFGRVPLLSALLRSAHAARPPAPLTAVKRGMHRWSIAGRLFGLASGYIEALPDGSRRLLPGHSYAITLFLFSLLFYGALIFGKSPSDVALAEQDLWVPTAGSIVMLLLLNSWGLSAMAFFFDRYRIPLVTALLAATAITGSRSCTDYEVATARQPNEHYQLATPGEVLAAFPRPLVVAAAGGGIQAGAWTARVLEGIDERLRDAGGLRARAALVSGVSGGSMGALYCGAYQDGLVRTATEMSLKPSLDEIASALIGVDHLRRVLGLRVGVDRGAALERSWALRLPEDRSSLRAWADRVRRFARHEDAAMPFPAFLFNTTIVETGAPMGFVTTQFPTATYRGSFSQSTKQYPVAESANRVFNLSSESDPQSAKDVGLQMVTAARLSAAFPYVSPAAALNVEGSERFHLVDGGYYDNYGLVAVTQWLDDALQEMTSPPADIGVVLIRGLNDTADEAVNKLYAGEAMRSLQAGSPEAPGRGWAWQYVAPPSAFLKTRSFGQWAGGMQALKLLAEKWRSRHVEIRLHLFDFPSALLPVSCQAAPLSWKLSKPQQKCIDLAWPIAASQESATTFWSLAK
jgi:hypothetical protein